MHPLAAVAVAYLIGSFPSAYVYTRLLGGRDIRQVGSGNVGGMNTFRNVGPLPGLLTAVTDVTKGILAVWLATRWFPGWPLLVGLAAVSVVAGHNWMPWLGMRGGKGLGASAGALAIYQPASIGVFLAAYAVGLTLFRNSYTAVVMGAAALPLSMWLLGGTLAHGLAGLGLAIVIIAKHMDQLREYFATKRRR
jgi:glycerol-3-phosphate acyltransferase PlsY